MSNYQILVKANEAISAKDHQGFIAFCDENIIWNMIGDESLVGTKALKEWLDKTYTEPPIFSITQSIEQGDLLAVRGEITIKDKAGQATHSKYCDVWRFRNGKLAELNAYAIVTE